MKKLALLAISFTTLFTANSQDINEQKISSEIEEVTVFITGGEVKRNIKVNVTKGRNKLIFTRISTVADHKSVQFNADKKFDLVSVSSEMDYVTFIQNNPRIQNIKDTILIMDDKLIDLSNEKSAYNEEKQLLLRNNVIKGEQQNLSVEELKSMAVFYRTRMMELNKILTKYDKDIREINTVKYRYSNQLTELNYQETIKSNQIIVIVDSDINQTLDVDLKYVVSNCGWQANYDLSAADVKGKINLKYKAKVYNNTGNDWNNINITLSTSDPNLTASAPALKPWFLNYSSLTTNNDFYKGNEYVVPERNEFKQYYQNASSPSINSNISGLIFDGNATGQTEDFWNGQSGKPQMNFTTIEVSELSTEFKIEEKYTIPSDSKPYLVEVADNELTATFSHKAVPKLDKDAFLLANIVGWEELDLVPGPTNVYFADTYVGQSYVNTRNVGDTLRLSFGRDNRISITRKKLEEFSDKKVIGNNRKDNYMYEISVKNNRDIPVSIDLFDQIPISQDSDISVSVDEISSAVYNETTGKLVWKVNLNPSEIKKYKIGFTIKYPKDKQLQVRKYRSIAAPKF